MKPRVLALDFDGTIAEHDAINADTAAAIREARGAGLLTVLVTGRILSDLDALFRDPPPFDAIVAENGAVLRLPGLPSPITFSRRPDPRFLAELSRRGIQHQSGQCVVEADADTASHIVEIIRSLGLPLAITFNVGRLMVLPHGVSKASGLQEALWRLRASVHNAVAIGNAENDHQLLEVCEIGAAVAWGSDVLKRSADEVVPGDGPRAVAPYIRDILSRPRIPPERMGRRLVHLGTLRSGMPLDVAIRGRNVLVGGDPKSGKSWVAGLLCEQLILQRYSLCIVDPEGDYMCLEALPGAVVDILAASEAVIVTRIEDRRQALALLTVAPGAAPSEWLAMLASLGIDEAALLPRLGETGDSVKRFRVAPRLTAHVRHRAKYADVPVRPDQAFVFTLKG